MEEGSALSPTGSLLIPAFLFVSPAMSSQAGTKEECARLGEGGVVSFKNKIVPI